MVARGRDAACAQKLAKLLDGLAARAVDDARLVLALAYERDHAAILGLAAGRPLHEELEIGPVEAREHRVGIAQAEGARDVVADRLRRRRGERHHRRTGRQGVDELDDALVRRPEVVAPLADAVSLVDGEQRHAALGGDRKERGVVQALRRDVDEGERACRDAVKHVGLLGAGKRRVEAARRDAALPKRPHLVCHERDQGRDDHREAARALGKRDGGHLVADRLARRGGHDGEHVFACERGIHDAQLVRAEALVAEGLAEYVCRRAIHDSRLHPPRGSREAGAA